MRERELVRGDVKGFCSSDFTFRRSTFITVGARACGLCTCHLLCCLTWPVVHFHHRARVAVRFAILGDGEKQGAPSVAGAGAGVQRQFGNQGTIVRQETALEIRREVVVNQEEVYKVTCSNVDDIDEVWRDLGSPWPAPCMGVADFRNE